MKGRFIFIAILFFITGITRIFGFLQNRAAVPEGNIVLGIISILVPFILAVVAIYLEIRFRKKEK